MKSLKTTLFLWIIVTNLFAQNLEIARESYFTAGLFQIKESANFGLVFKGPEINYGMTWEFRDADKLMIYESELGLEILFSKGIPALGFRLKPIDFAYMFKLPLENYNLLIGPSIKCEYIYNLYPDLQSGFDYWFTTISVGINTLFDFNYQTSSFRIKLNSSLIGFTSRQPDYRDPYFYDLGFSHAIKHLHLNFTIGSLDMFNTTNLEILWKPNPKSRITYGYLLKYAGYYKNPELRIVNHNIKLLIGKKQK